ncbi:MAG: bifunctional oligoribonuclease/PAP phosphatase NrnA [Phycisphaerae bacterium]|nr:bifunctional oligoribonuclease/PAP phosphatase NrnA [Phycisphaerae bacterium]
MITADDFKQAIALIEHSHHVLITTHTRPDGDACGSVRAMVAALAALGKTAQPIFLSPLPEWYEFLFEQKVPILGNDITPDDLNAPRFADVDLVLIVDTNSYVQLPQFDEWLRAADKNVLVIDHHITGDNLGRVQLIDTSAAAAGEIVFDLYRHAGWPITPPVAEALFVALATDSGWFKFSNVDSRLLRNAADLVDAGADPNAVYRKLYQNFSPSRMDLLICVLNSMSLHFDGRVAAQHLLRSDFDATGATGRDTENLIDECQRIASVDVALLFVELADNGFRCSLRSKGKVDVRKIAQKFGGGGHTMASGVNLPGPLEHAQNLILTELAKQLNP